MLRTKAYFDRRLALFYCRNSRREGGDPLCLGQTGNMRPPSRRPVPARLTSASSKSWPRPPSRPVRAAERPRELSRVRSKLTLEWAVGVCATPNPLTSRSWVRIPPCPLSVFNGEDTHAAGGTPIPPAAPKPPLQATPRTCPTPKYRRQRNGRHHDGHKFQWPGLLSERNLRTWIAAVLKRRG